MAGSVVPHPGHRRRPRAVTALALTAALLALAGCGRADTGATIESATAPSAATPATDGGEPSAETAPGDPGSGQAAPSDPGAVQAAPPTRVRIPAIGVDASTVPLGLRSDGTIEVPTDFAQTGWWVDGPEPGETGPAVILGHVDSRDGPAVFFDLGRLQADDLVHIDREDGTTVSYAVERVEQHPKNAFPSDAVYGKTDDAVIRLVTCGGEFDRDRRSYDDNIIVFGRLVTDGDQA